MAINFDGPTYLHQQVADEIRGRCQAGEYPRGHRIPGYLTLATEFGVSDRTVRKAVATLVDEGILVTRPGKGTYCV